jgi:hypothetical protein
VTISCLDTVSVVGYKVSRGWSFWSVIRTSFLSCSCFFLLLVEVEGVGDGSGKEGREDEEGRFFFSLSA